MRVVIFLLLISTVAAAQNIRRVEYFFDIDPGQGNGISIPFTQAADVAINTNINISALSDGFHMLYIRAKDENAKWSLLGRRPVVVQTNVFGGPSSQISRLEYFFDSDPGQGNGRPIPFAASSDITANSNLTFTGLNGGVHTLYIRAKDTNARWSLLHSRPVVIQNNVLGSPQSTLSRFEYFFDTDPGFGAATPITIAARANVSQAVTAGLSTATPGFHTLYVRAKDSNGTWSLPFAKPVVAARINNMITRLEYYFIDGTTTTAKKTYSTFTPGTDVTIDYNAILVGLATNTTYEIHITAIDASGIRSAEVVKTFTTPLVICNIAPPNSNNASRCDNGTVTFTATGAGAAPSDYNWFDVATGGTLLAVGATYVPTLTASQTFYVNVVDGLGVCESARTAVTGIVTVTPAPPSGSGATICSPAAVTLTAGGVTNGQYRWYASATGGLPIAGAVNSNYVTPVLSATTTLYVSAINGTCESARTPLLVAFCNRAPSISKTSVAMFVHGDTTINIKSLIRDADNNLDSSSLKIKTALPSGAVATIDKNYNLTIDYRKAAFAGTEDLTIEICDKSGSCTQQIISVQIQGELVVFNAVSPNGDGKNDYWYIQNIEILDETKANHVSVYNRWGDVVFETDTYDNQTNVFAGVGKGGNQLPTGIYYYKIEFKSSRPAMMGFLDLRW
jgi:gliding motility-associated-like protein